MQYIYIYNPNITLGKVNVSEITLAQIPPKIRLIKMIFN